MPGFWDAERESAIEKVAVDEQLNKEKLQTIIDDYLFTHQPIERDDVIKSLNFKPKLLERKKIATRVIDKVMNFVETFINGVAS